jgi:hypothetical protein
MNIYITLNTIRDFETAFANAYQLQLESEETDYIDFEEIGSDEPEGEWKEINDKKEEKLERYYEPIHSEWHHLTLEHEFFSKEDFDNFIDYYAFEIFSRAGLKISSHEFNQLYVDLVNLGHKVTVISQEKITSKSSTLIWMGTNKIQANNIKFLENYSEIWKDCDMLVSDVKMEWPEKPEMIVTGFSGALEEGQKLE